MSKPTVWSLDSEGRPVGLAQPESPWEFMMLMENAPDEVASFAVPRAWLRSVRRRPVLAPIPAKASHRRRYSRG